jgi:hypothetical protein
VIGGRGGGGGGWVVRLEVGLVVVLVVHWCRYATAASTSYILHALTSASCTSGCFEIGGTPLTLPPPPLDAAYGGLAMCGGTGRSGETCPGCSGSAGYLRMYVDAGVDVMSWQLQGAAFGGLLISAVMQRATDCGCAHRPPLSPAEDASDEVKPQAGREGAGV